MRVYHIGLHEYATVVRHNGDRLLVQYDGSEQIWDAKTDHFKVVEDQELEAA